MPRSRMLHIIKKAGPQLFNVQASGRCALRILMPKSGIDFRKKGGPRPRFFPGRHCVLRILMPKSWKFSTVHNVPKKEGPTTVHLQTPTCANVQTATTAQASTVLTSPCAPNSMPIYREIFQRAQKAWIGDYIKVLKSPSCVVSIVISFVISVATSSQGQLRELTQKNNDAIGKMEVLEGTIATNLTSIKERLDDIAKAKAKKAKAKDDLKMDFKFDENDCVTDDNIRQLYARWMKHYGVSRNWWNKESSF